MARIPYFSKCNAVNIPAVETGYGEQPLSNLDIIANSIDTVAASSVSHSIPDMLQPDFSLESDLRSQDPIAFSQWIGFMCALLLGGDQVITDTYAATDLLIPQNTLFMRALGRMLEARLITSLTMYAVMVPQPDGTKKKTAIGYSYQDTDAFGVKATHYCPAAYIRYDLTGCVHAGCFDQASMRFTNPIDLLKDPAYGPQAAAVANGLHAKKNMLPSFLWTPVSRFIADLGVLDLRVELRPFGGIAYVADGAKAIAAWFGPKLLIMEQGYDGMYINCYGNVKVYDNKGNPINTKVILPLTAAYAQKLWNIQHAPVPNPAEITEIRDCFETAVVTAYPTKDGRYRYVIYFSYNGENYSATYPESDCEYLLNLTVPFMAVWPQREDATWSEYFVYCRHSDQQAAQTMKLRPCSFDRNGLLVEHAPTFDRVTNDSRAIWDECTPIDQFPSFVSVYCNGQQIGYIMPRPDHTPAAALAPSVIAIDFGSTNTIAFAKVDGAVPAAINVGIGVLPVCGSYDKTEITLNFANPAPYAEAQYLTMLNTFGRHNPPAADYKLYEEATIPFTKAITVTYERASHLWLDLKWNKKSSAVVSPQEMARTRAFMQQIAMVYKWNALQAGTVLGAGGLTWRFAYPRSMDPAPLTALKNCFGKIFNGFKVEFCSEAMAVGKCLTSPNLVAQSMAKGYAAVSGNAGYMIMDIGGGTVDMSLWQTKAGDAEASIRSESSMLGVAGAFAIQEMIQHKYAVGIPANTKLLWQLWGNRISKPSEQVEKLKESVIQALLNQMPLTDTAPVEVQLIAYMEARNDPRMTGDHITQIDRMFDTTWCTNISEITAQIENRCKEAAGDATFDEIRQLISKLELYFYMLTFYAGEMTGAAISEGLFSVNSDTKFTLAFAGNGSTMLRFLPEFSTAPNAVGVSFINSNLQKTMCTFFLRGLCTRTNESLNIQILEPLMPKQEVAYGLCAATNVTDAAEVTSQWISSTDQTDIVDRAKAFSKVWQEVNGMDIHAVMTENANSVLANIAGKRRDTAFRDLIHHTLE